MAKRSKEKGLKNAKCKKRKLNVREQEKEKYKGKSESIRMNGMEKKESRVIRKRKNYFEVEGRVKGKERESYL